MATRDSVEIFTDGACSGNPGPGGWGAVLRYQGVEKELQGGEPETTNNRMEMLAAIHALEAMKRPVHAVIHTASTYLHDGIQKWIHAWKRRGWKTAAKNQSKMWIYGSGWRKQWHLMRLNGAGSRVMQATRRTNAPTP